LATTAISAVLASDVHDLNSESFNDFFAVEDPKPVLLEFFAPWCGHCKALAPHYEEAATALKEQAIRLAKVDCDANAALCEEHGIRGYPTLKVVRDGDVKGAKPYGGQRTADAIITYMEKQSKDVIEALDSSAALDAFKSHKIAFVAFYDQADKDTAATFKGAAEEFRDDPYLFGAVTDPEVAKAEGVSFPAIVTYRSFDEPKVALDGAITAQSVASFVRLYSLHLFGEIGPDTYNAYSKAELPLGYVFVENRDDVVLMDGFRAAAKKHHGKINIATIDAALYGAHADKVNLKQGQWPAFSIQDFVSGKKYVFDQSKDLTPEAIDEFVTAFVNGDVPPSLKSEEIPTAEQQAETPVTIVVAHTYDQLVLDDDVDVLLEYYAPWCGHCKKLAPDYEILASKYAPFSDKVRIAKIDATANDVDSSIQGFPTIKLYPAGNKGKPVDYAGNRTPEHFAEFIAEHGKHKLNAYTEKAPEPVEEPVETAVDTATKPVSSEAAEETGKDEL